MFLLQGTSCSSGQIPRSYHQRASENCKYWPEYLTETAISWVSVLVTTDYGLTVLLLDHQWLPLVESIGGSQMPQHFTSSEYLWILTQCDITCGLNCTMHMEYTRKNKQEKCSRKHLWLFKTKYSFCLCLSPFLSKKVCWFPPPLPFMKLPVLATRDTLIMQVISSTSLTTIQWIWATQDLWWIKVGLISCNFTNLPWKYRLFVLNNIINPWMTKLFTLTN